MASTAELIETICNLIETNPVPIPITLMNHGIDEAAAIIGGVVERCARESIVLTRVSIDPELAAELGLTDSWRSKSQRESYNQGSEPWYPRHLCGARLPTVHLDVRVLSCPSIGGCPPRAVFQFQLPTMHLDPEQASTEAPTERPDGRILVVCASTAIAGMVQIAAIPGGRTVKIVAFRQGLPCFPRIGRAGLGHCAILRGAKGRAMASTRKIAAILVAGFPTLAVEP